jgi:hypothetical protein
MATARRGAKRLDIILPAIFLSCAERGFGASESSPRATAHIGRQRGFTIEAICRMHLGNLWVFVARGRDSKCKLSSRLLGRFCAWKSLGEYGEYVQEHAVRRDYQSN